MSSFLDQMREWVREDLEQRRRETPIEDLRDIAIGLDVRRSFLEAFQDRPGIVAEIKRASPTAGQIDRALEVEERSVLYERAGAVGLSVLTQPRGFLGSGEDLLRARSAVDLPILRKDFILDPYQVVEAKAWGADAVLLIVAFLEANRLVDLYFLAADLGLEILLEVHTREDLAVAAEIGAEWIGVNTRDLSTLTVHPEVHEELAPELPPNVVTTAESGIESASRIRRLRELGYRAFLVGSALMAHAEPERLLEEMIHASAST